MDQLNQVVTKSLNSGSNALTIVAGTGSAGSASNMLSSPYGIFVDINFDLYVADCGNNRIQLFQSGQLDATTVAGSGSSTTTITLKYPSGIVLDADKNLFIVDNGNNRIVGPGPNGFQCLVGCSGGGSVSNQLDSPQSMAFDNYGNIFITDMMNNRIQKFILLTQLCGKYNKNTIV
jgi:sugar lactone lactonase YvrE